MGEVELKYNPEFSVSKDREDFSLPGSEWGWMVAFMLSMSFAGLMFPPAYVLVFILLLRSMVKNRYDFIIQMVILCGSYGFYDDTAYPVKLQDILFVVSLLCWIVYRQTPCIKKITFAMLGYFAVLFLLATTSAESMSVQFRMMRHYMAIVAIFPIMAVFSGRVFDIDMFYRKVLGYSLIACAFYAIDCFIVNGFLLFPNLSLDGKMAGSTITNIIWHPFWFPRKYPPGLYVTALAIVPLLRRYRLSRVQWAIVFLGVVSTRTMTFIAGLVVTYIIFKGKLMQLLRAVLYAAVLIVSLYFIDGFISIDMRVRSTIDQFIKLENIQDQEDLAEFGSGRMAQLIPKMEYMYECGREWTGFGFLHPELTKNPDLIIENLFYLDQSEETRFEVVTSVEITQGQTLLDIGYIGLAAQILFYVGIYYIIRKMRHSSLYLSVLIAISVFGLGGFAGVTTTQGLLILSLALAAVLLSNRKWQIEEEGNSSLING